MAVGCRRRVSGAIRDQRANACATDCGRTGRSGSLDASGRDEGENGSLQRGNRYHAISVPRQQQATGALPTCSRRHLGATRLPPPNRPRERNPGVALFLQGGDGNSRRRKDGRRECPSGLAQPRGHRMGQWRQRRLRQDSFHRLPRLPNKGLRLRGRLLSALRSGLSATGVPRRTRRGDHEIRSRSPLLLAMRRGLRGPAFSAV
jgi:hypothetical protein